MRKIKHSVYNPHKNTHIYYVCAAYREDITLCSKWGIDALDKETTDPITCQDCLAIIRECKSLEMPGMKESDGYTETSRQFAQDHDIMTTMLTE